MEIKNKVAEAIVESVITLSTTDKVALGYAFESLKAEIAIEDAYDAWNKLPYDEKNKRDEDGHFVNPCPGASSISTNLINDLRKLAKFIDKIAIYPSSSNIFDDEEGK